LISTGSEIYDHTHLFVQLREREGRTAASVKRRRHNAPGEAKEIGYVLRIIRTPVGLLITIVMPTRKIYITINSIVMKSVAEAQHCNEET